jgi:hypothetical protein
VYKLPEDSNYVETCRSKLIAEYIIYRIVHLFGADTVCKSVHNAWNEEQ